MITSWEAGEPTGTLTGDAAITSNYGAYDGVNSLYLFARRRTTPPPTQTSSTWVSPAYPVEPGVPQTIAVYTNGDNASSIMLNLSITDGATVTTYTLTAPLGIGWKLWQTVVHIPVNAAIAIKINAPAPTSLPPGSIGIGGAWLVDKLQILAPVEAAAMASKLAAMDALIAALKTIDGTEGFRMNLESRVFDAVINPDDDHVQAKLPYACIDELDEDLERAGEDLEDGLHATWDVAVLFYVAETWADKFNSSARRDARKISDDCKQLVLSFPTLGEEVHAWSLLKVSPGDCGAMPDASWAEVVVIVRIEQFIGLDSLT